MATKLTDTQARILANARAGKALTRPVGASEHGGWNRSVLSCFKNGYLREGTKPHGDITDLGVAALAAWESKR